MKPWITKGILKSIQRRNQLYGKIAKAKSHAEKTRIFQEFKRLRNEIVNITRISKKKFYSKYFSNNAKDMKKIWQGINEIVNVKSRQTSSINCISKNGKITTDPSEITEHFNDYFSTVASNILNKRKYNGNKHFNQYLKNANASSFFISPTNETEIKSIINSFDTKKSNGPNSIPNCIIKGIKEIIAAPLCNIFNKSFTSGVYPDNFKISKTIPIFKKGSRLETSNYRPISLLSNINKILEKLMHSRLYKFLETFNCIYELQFGFREKHSTNHALISITENIRKSLDDDKLAVGIFIDLQKAFDTVNHSILLSKLEHYGIRGISNDWFKSYLTDIKQFVSINGFNSKMTDVKHGVPQGSVLGPLLFLMYINDMHECVKNSQVFHFADDTNLLHISKNSYTRMCRKINTDLKSLSNWLLANKISLNVQKTELIFFKKPCRELPMVNKIKMNGVKITPSPYIKYLGVYIDANLNWKKHTEQLNTKLNRANGMLALARHYINNNALLSLYHGSFSSHLNYACQIWGQNINENSKTFLLQKKSVRIITFSDFRSHSSPLFKELKILTLIDKIILNNCVLVYNILKGQIPKNLVNMFEMAKDNHRYLTSNSSNTSVKLSSVKTNYGRNSICFKSCTQWNKIMKELNSEKIRGEKREGKYWNKTETNADNCWILDLSNSQIKNMITKYFLKLY